MKYIKYAGSYKRIIYIEKINDNAISAKVVSGIGLNEYVAEFFENVTERDQRYIDIIGEINK